MKAITIVKPGLVEIREIEKPVIGKDEALLKPLFGGICGSDLNSYRGTNAYLTYPRIPGHEFSAEIVEIGENDRGFKPGDIVTANPYFNCGKCYSCRRGLVNACMSNQTMGVQREGGFSEYMAMPISRLIDGKGLDAKTLALIEPFCIGYHGIQRAGVKDGDTGSWWAPAPSACSPPSPPSPAARRCGSATWPPRSSSTRCASAWTAPC